MLFSVLAGGILLLGLAFQAKAIFTSAKRVPPARSMLAWAVVYALATALLSVMGFAGLLTGGECALPPALFASALLTLLSWATVGGPRLQGILMATCLGRRERILLEAGLLVLFGALSVLTIELPWSHVIPFGGPSFWWLELAIALLLSASLYLVSGRRGAGVLPAHALFLVIGVAQYFIRQFKNSAILPNDILALGTAMAVGRQYTYSLDPQALMALAFSFVPVFVLSLLTTEWTKAPVMAVDEPADEEGEREAPVRQPARLRLAEVGLGALCGLGCVALVAVPSYMGQLGVEIAYWYSINSYEEQGFLPTFIAVLQDMPIREPEGYSDESAKEALDDLSREYDETSDKEEDRTKAAKQFAEDDVSVIAVMNESFADLSEFDGLKSGYEGPEFFKGIDDALFRGKLYLNVHGAGTCNSEFEFLTGNSLGYIGAGKYPYSSFKMDGIDNLARQFDQMGYETTAIHPNYASNWNRDRIYPTFGFHRFLDMDAFGGFPEKDEDGNDKRETPTGTPIFHSGVSDQATYERVLELLESDDRPQFVFDVTMQNHGSYNQANIPGDKLTDYQPEDTYGPSFEETPERLNEYLSCVAESDRALEWLIGRLRSLDRKVVLIFFGDHQPSLTPAYNDAWYVGEDEVTHAQRIYHANYLVWANYDVAGAGQESRERTTSVDMLAAEALHEIGAPLTAYQKAQVQTGLSIPAMNLHGYLGADGEWHAPDEQTEYSEAYGRMALVEHLNFARRL